MNAIRLIERMNAKGATLAVDLIEGEETGLRLTIDGRVHATLATRVVEIGHQKNAPAGYTHAIRRDNGQLQVFTPEEGQRLAAGLEAAKDRAYSLRFRAKYSAAIEEAARTGRRVLVSSDHATERGSYCTELGWINPDGTLTFDKVYAN